MDEILYELRDHVAGPERRPLGLPVQHHQELPRRRAGVRPAGPQRGDHDRADDARLHRTAGRAPATGAARSRSAAWRRSSRAAATPRSTSARFAKVREDKDARGRPTASTGPGWRTPTWCRCAARSSTGCSASRPNQLDRLPRRRHASTADDLLDVTATPGEVTEAGLRSNIDGRRCSTSRPGSAGNGAVGDPQPDGGRRHGGDLPLAGLAVGVQRRDPGHRRDGHPRAGRADGRGGVRRAPRRVGAAESTPSTSPRPAACSWRPRWTRSFRTSSRCRRTAPSWSPSGPRGASRRP